MFADPTDPGGGSAVGGRRSRRRARHAAAEPDDVRPADDWPDPLPDAGRAEPAWPADAASAIDADPPTGYPRRHRRAAEPDPWADGDAAPLDVAQAPGAESARDAESASDTESGSDTRRSARTEPAAGARSAPDGQPAPEVDRAGGRQRRPGRGSGRNLPAAIGVGLLLGALVLGSLSHPLPFALVVAAAAAAGVWEMVRALGVAGLRPPLVPLLLGAAVIPVLGFLAGSDGLAGGLLVTVLAAMIWRLGDGPEGYEKDVAAAALVAVYVPFLLGFAAPLAHAQDGMHRVLLTLAVVVLSDTGGYAVGVRFGRRRMAPTVSPKKSWEGFGGSLLAAGLGGALLAWALLDLALWRGFVFGVLIAVVAVFGDLAESMIKRDLKVKDMSNLLPGHGGLMDRLDSIIFAVPTAYLLLTVLAPVAG
ncbi:hypothetical protein GCM10010124_20700 [Pilimelia terevasa]|uniref:Phosphatidate cytidylyltransferase n=1 Tax=Pilimelia terevasa TaxID=53372 RepID=A0A8J3BNY3_9ACTN|nr:phosphatidate cytidylyltransferase [Pilimelia terevasa]GGK27965.1 hypothetical protein GCM10010124_20700 [Pilimelia terevasa]